jgi:hypothetical protein
VVGATGRYRSRASAREDATSGVRKRGDDFAPNHDIRIGPVRFYDGMEKLNLISIKYQLIGEANEKRDAP